MDLAVMGGRLYMAVAPSGTGSLDIYVLSASGSPLASRTWTQVVALPFFPTLRRPALVAVRDPIDRTKWRLTVVIAGTDGKLYWAQGPTDAAGPASSWTFALYFGAGQVSVETPAVVFDDRALLPERLRDLRVYRSIVRPGELDCASTASCSPGETCLTYGGRAMCTLGDDVQTDIEMNPFPNGRAPGVFADYDDWVAIQYAACASLQAEAYGSSFLPPGSPYRPTGATLAIAVEGACGPLPIWAEPSSTGMSSTAWPSLGDCTSHPALYTHPEMTCP